MIFKCYSSEELITLNTLHEVIASGYAIASSSGALQGNLIGPVLLALAVDQITIGVESELNAWYHDDAAIGGSHKSVLCDVQKLITGL